MEKAKVTFRDQNIAPRIIECTEWVYNVEINCFQFNIKSAIADEILSTVCIPREVVLAVEDVR